MELLESDESSPTSPRSNSVVRSAITPLVETNCETSNETCNEESVVPPEKGMTFISWEKIEERYKLYAKSVGFGVSRVQGAKDSIKERRAVTWRCECWGKPKKKVLVKTVDGSVTKNGHKPKVRRRKSKKCDCKAKVYASRNKQHLWVIRNVILEHNGHNPTPNDARLVKEYRMQAFTENLRRRVINDVEEGVPISLIHGSIARERDGLANMPITRNDMQHVVDKERKLKLSKGDAEALLGYLDRMRRDNKEFYYTLRVDSTGGLQDAFWVDARSKAAYEEFGDVVCFDTTYMTNLYDLPFANFVGVNHHGQTTLFGCALIAFEDIETFTWVFHQWLLCMGNNAPRSILTDQAPAIQRGVEATMPNTTHRWCLWHIMQKIPIKLGGLSSYKKMKKALKRVIYNSSTPNDFDYAWPIVIEKYGLQKNKWLSDLFEDRAMWISAYLNDIFWAGMRTTQRVESMHSFFDKYVKRHTTLIEFGEKYTAAVEKRMCQERDADDRDRKWHREPTTEFELERFFADIYTDEKFGEVQIQCERVGYGFVIQQQQLDEEEMEYVIKDAVWIYTEGCRSDKRVKGSRQYKVVYNKVTHKVVCQCRMFETNGIMCRHQIRILYQNGIMTPPEMYVLNRWKKNLQRKHQLMKVAYHDPRRTIQVKRLDMMQNLFDVLAHKSCMHDIRTVKVMNQLKDLIQSVDGLVDVSSTETMDANNDAATGGHNSNTVAGSITPSQAQADIYDNQNARILTAQRNTTATVSPNDIGGNGRVIQTLRDPPTRKKRGRPKGSRLKSDAERSIEKSSSKKSGTKKKKGVVSDTDEDGSTSNDTSNLDATTDTANMMTRSQKQGTAKPHSKRRLHFDYDSSSDDQSMSF